MITITGQDLNKGDGIVMLKSNNSTGQYENMPLTIHTHPKYSHIEY
jgi:hypothetical protein